MARCDAAGGATFAPLAEALRAFLALDDSLSLDESAGDGDLHSAVEAALPAEALARFAELCAERESRV